MTTYTLEIDFPRDIPDDVFIEHIGAALSKLLKVKPDPKPTASVKIVAKNGDKAKRQFAEPVATWHEGQYVTAPTGTWTVNAPRAHPFDGPEVFDDDITSLTPQDVVDKVFKALHEDFPNLAHLLKVKREEHEVKRSADNQEPPAEGDWELPTEDHVGED